MLNCTICRKPYKREGNPFRPFCSERCRVLDLQGWLNEEYRVPGEDANVDSRQVAPQTDSGESTENSKNRD